MLLYYDIAHVQLMPNTWRILLSLSLGILSERHDVRFGLGCLLHNYYLKEHVTDQGHYTLVPRSKEHQLITNTTTNDSHWKDTYFFAKGPPIDGPWGETQYQYRRTWNRFGECRSTVVVSFFF